MPDIQKVKYTLLGIEMMILKFMLVPLFNH
jgi:hypothetical protein